jgi:dienelactone hydrolase
VTVLIGEGTTEIIYGSTSIPAGARTLGGYLSRPDLDGDWPTILVFGPDPMPTSAVKAMCRRMARHAIAALAPEMTGGSADRHLTAIGTAAFAASADGGWSNARFGYGVVGFGSGIHDAAALASNDPRVVAVAAVGATLDDAAVDDLASADVPVLFIGSRSDDSVDVDRSVEARDEIPRTAYAIYGTMQAHWWDIEAPDYDEEMAFDTFDRLVGFFGEQLPVRI